MLTTSGRNMKFVNIKERGFSTVVFDNMENIYMAIAPEDLTAIDKVGGVHTAKKGDIVIKSNCEEVYGVVPASYTIAELLGFVKEQKDIKRKDLDKEQAYPVPMEDCVSSNECVGCNSERC